MTTSLPPIPFNIIRHLTLDERNQLYQYIATITNQPPCEGHQPSVPSAQHYTPDTPNAQASTVPSGSAAPASTHDVRSVSSFPDEKTPDIIQLSFYVIITIATLLSALVIYNSCINN